MVLTMVLSLYYQKNAVVTQEPRLRNVSVLIDIVKWTLHKGAE